jgi:hypothetical protein
MGYAKTGKSWSKSRFGETSALVCLAICEVAKAPGVPEKPNPYYVVKEADYVATRFFCFYLKQTGLSLQVKTLDLAKYVS